MVYRKYKIIAILLFQLLRSINTQNLFCNSDFEGYPIINYDWMWGGYNVSNSNMINDECWYNPDIGYFQLERLWNVSTYTQAVKFYFDNTPYQICQNATLQIGSLYNFTFQIAMFPEMETATGYGYINSILVSNVTAYAASFPKLTSITHIFVADTQNNTFCAKGSETWKGENKTEIYQLSTQFDNFFLIKVKQYKAPTIIQYLVKTYEQLRKVQISTSNYLPIQTLHHILNNAIIKIGGELQSQVSYQIKEGNLLKISVSFNKIADLKTFQLELAGMFVADSQNTIAISSFIFEGLKTMFYPMQKALVDQVRNLQSVSTHIFREFFNIYNRGKIIGCSYFQQILFPSLVQTLSTIFLTCLPSLNSVMILLKFQFHYFQTTVITLYHSYKVSCQKESQRLMKLYLHY